MAERRRQFQARTCAHCGIELFRPDSKVICDYMLTDEVWESIGFKPNEVACLRCAEQRLERSLVVGDFMKAILNRTVLWCLERGIKPWLDDR